MQCLKVQIWLLLVLAAIIGICAGCYKKTGKYKVLLIQSYDQGYTNAPLLVKGAKDYFEKQGIDVDLDIYYLDCEIRNASEEIHSLTELMESYRDTRLDLVIVCDDQATYSLLATKHPKTFSVPIVFCGVDYFNSNLLAGHSNVTGLMLKHDYKQYLGLAKKVFGVKHIYFLTDSTFLGKQFRDDFQKQLKESGDSVQVEYLNATNLRSKHLIWRFNTAKPNSIFIIPRYDNIYPVFSSKASAPVFVMSNEAFNDNIFYGYIVQDEMQTKEAAKIGIQILSGTKSADMPVIFHEQKMIFNWKQLKKWKVDEASLPAGSVIVGIPFSKQYKYYIIIGCAILFFLILYLISLYLKELHLKRKVQQNLFKQRNEFDITLSALSEGVISINCKGELFGINKRAMQFLHLNSLPDDYLGQDIHSLVSMINANNKSFCLGDIIQNVLNKNKATGFPEKTFLLASDGSTFPVSGEVTPIFKDNDLYGAVIVFRDISNEYTQKEYLGLTFNESKVYPWQYDSETRVVSYGNDVLSGQGSSYFSLGDIEQVIHPDELPSWKKLLHGIFEGEIKKGIYQFRGNYGNKGYEWWEYRFSSMPETLMLPPSKIFGICVNVEDIKRKESELVLARDLAAKAELKQSFLANMSHEIRTPLNAIVGFSNLLVNQEDLDEEEKNEFVLSINKNSELLLKLVNDVLELSRMDSGNMSFKEETFDVIALIDDIYVNIQIMVPDGVALEKIVPAFPVFLFTDRLRLTQVLNNFLSNAVKFTGNGIITLGCTFEVKGFIDLFVEDTGKGISDEEQFMVFDRFYKSDEFAQGTGLGLSICKIIVERLGGSIILKSQVGKGSRFIVRMPYNKGI